jgi:hypothetical protein
MPPYIPGKVVLVASRTDHIGVREMFEIPNIRIVPTLFVLIARGRFKRE